MSLCYEDTLHYPKKKGFSTSAILGFIASTV